MFCSQCGAKLLESAKFCAQCGLSVGTGVQPSRPVTHEIRQIGIDFKQLFGCYPVCYHTFNPKGSKDSQRWEPPGFDYDRVKGALLAEISKWMSDGWELVEADIDRAIISRNEAVNDTMGNLLGFALSYVMLDGLMSSKHTRKFTYIGASFHIRR